MKKFAVTAGMAGVLFVAAGCTPTNSPATTLPSATESPSKGSGTKSPTSTSSAKPTPTAKTWSEDALYDACVGFQAEWATDNDYSSDDFSWPAYTPEAVEAFGDAWYVILRGTVKTPDGTQVPAEFACEISGTPDKPTIIESKRS